MTGTEVRPSVVRLTGQYRVWVICILLLLVSLPASLLNKGKADFWPVKESRDIEFIAGEFRDRLKTSEKRSEALARLLVEGSREAGLSPYFVMGLIEVESTFNPDAESYAGARGLLQLMPRTAQKILLQGGRSLNLEEVKAELMDPEANLTLGLLYLKELNNQFDHPFWILGAYRMGPTRLKQSFRQLDAEPENDLKGDLTLVMGRFPETAAYVKKVKQAERRLVKRFQRLYAPSLKSLKS